MCNKEKRHREEALNMLTEMYLILSAKTFFGGYSLKTPRLWRNQLHALILAHSSTHCRQILKVPGPLRWTWIFSSLHRFSIGFRLGDWLGHSSSFIFFLWNHLTVSLTVCLGSLSCWNIHPWFIFSILADGSKFLSRISLYFSPFIFPSLIWSLPVPHAEKQSHTMMFPPPNLMCSAISPPNTVCPMTSEELNFGLIWPDYVLLECHGFVQMLCHKLQTSINMLFLQEWSLAWCVCMEAMAVESITDSRSFWSSPQVVLGCGGTLLIIVRSIWSWPVYGDAKFFPLLDDDPNGAHCHFQKFQNVPVTNFTQFLLCFATIRLRGSSDSSLLLPIIGCFLCDILVMRNLCIGIN